MKLFLDTANIEQIEDAFRTGAISGVTTNPSLLSKEPKTDFYAHIQKIADLCATRGNNCPLSVEVFAKEPRAMVDQAMRIVNTLQYDNINIKVPVGYEELSVISTLHREGVRVNCTCCFTATQMQLAAAAGARYVSLFYNRLIDVGGNPVQVLERTRDFIDQNELNSEIIAGSIRNAYDLEDCWAAGAHIVTAGHNVVRKSTLHAKTDESVNGFLSDFEKWIN